MTNKSQKKKKKKQVKSKATTRQTGGAGFEFEDLTAAWLMVKMLRGVVMPGINVTGIELLWQTEPLGWDKIDDLLVKCKGQNSEPRQLAISCKSNIQVTGSGLPSDFVNPAWKLFQGTSPFQRERDCMALVQRGSNQNFFPVWNDLKSWSADGNTQTTVAKINSSNKHKKIYDSVKKPKGKKANFSDKDVIDLIRHLEVIPLDFQLTPSDSASSSLAHCRDILQDSTDKTANDLWGKLVSKANNKRIVGGALQLPELWKELVKNFSLNNHPDFASSWSALERITKEYKDTIEIELSTGFRVTRQAIEADLLDRVKSNSVCIIFGGSGSGKSAFVKSTLDEKLSDWKQIWLSPEDLNAALSVRTRGSIGLSQPLLEVFNSSSKNKNVLVIDAAERINPDCEKRTKQLLANLMSTNDADKKLSKWLVIIIGQTEAWADGKLQELSAAPSLNPIEVSNINSGDTRQALQSSPRLSWLSTDSNAVMVLSNLKTLAWVLQADTMFPENEIDKISIPAIADRLWSYWTGGKVKLQNSLMKFAEREALFERSFAISELGHETIEALDECPAQFPLRINKSTNRYEFEHDLAADWVRFQRLKEIKHDIAQWAPFASNPLWHSALRLLGQLLLRENVDSVTAWDIAFEAAEKSSDKNPLAADILLDALCLDPFAEHYLTERADMLFREHGAHLNRLLKRFHHIATVPSVPEELIKDAPSLQLYFEDYHRSPIYGWWPQVAKFLASHKQKVAKLISPVVAKVCETWLTTTPLHFSSGSRMLFRDQFAELAVNTARELQLAQGKQIIFLDDSEKPIYAAAFSAINDLPDEVTAWALEMSRRKPYRQDIVGALNNFREQKRKKEAERLRVDKAYRERKKALRSTTFISGSKDLPPWPIGPQGRVENKFREYCLQPHSLARLIIMRPQIASEIILAMIINDSPVEDRHNSLRLSDDLGLEYNDSCYPTAYWKSPFYQFFLLNSNVALDTFITLVNFCMERWEEKHENVSNIKINIKGSKTHHFNGGMQVFLWPQENSHRSGQLYSALAALERWLCMELDKGVDVTPVINSLLERTKSVAIIGVLINVGKYKPLLFANVLQPLLGAYELYLGDDSRVKNAEYSYDSWAWAREGEKIFEMAKEWIYAPFRKVTLRVLAVNLVNEQVKSASFISTASKKWEVPSDKKSALELRILKAELVPGTCKSIMDQKSGQLFLQCQYPDALQQEITKFQQENNPELQTITLPYQCEQILQSSKMLSDVDAETLSAALNIDPNEEDQDRNKTTKAAIASTLSVKAPTWLNERPDIAKQVNDIITGVVSDIGESLNSLISPNSLELNRPLTFVVYAISHKWIESESSEAQWDSTALKLLTSNDGQAAIILLEKAYINRDRLGDRWWRLLQIAIFWAGLCQLGPGFNENNNIERYWARWLRWLRTRDLNVSASIDDIDFVSIAVRTDRLKRLRIKRQFGANADGRLQHYHREFTGLDTIVLKQIFSWLLNENHQHTNDDRDVYLLTQKLWEFEVWCKKRREEKSDKDDLPSDLGYAILQKLVKLLLVAPKEEAVSLWKPVLNLGVDGRHVIEHFIDGWFLEIVRSKNTNALSQHWREMIEFALSSSNWSPKMYWYKGEQLFRHILGLNSGAFADFDSAKAIILEMKDLYKQWADEHLAKEEDNLAAFARFLSSKAGVKIRLDGLLWIQEALSPPNDVYFRREETGSSLIQLLDIIVSQDTQRISSDSSIRDSLLSVAAHLAAKQVPVALALQERIRQIH